MKRLKIKIELPKMNWVYAIVYLDQPWIIYANESGSASGVILLIPKTEK